MFETDTLCSSRNASRFVFLMTLIFYCLSVTNTKSVYCIGWGTRKQTKKKFIHRNASMTTTLDLLFSLICMHLFTRLFKIFKTFSKSIALLINDSYLSEVWQNLKNKQIPLGKIFFFSRTYHFWCFCKKVSIKPSLRKTHITSQKSSNFKVGNCIHSV